MTRVAVMGAGFQGTCAALELVRRGVEVDLYDQNEACITQAGARNDGKIHLGFVYANDASFDTARLLAQGALKFDAALRRWLECDIAGAGISTPHVYAVHRDSMLGPDAVLAYFARVRDLVRALADAAPSSYLGQNARTISFEPQELGATFDPETIAAVIRTDERSIDVRRVAVLLRERVAREPRITFHPGTRITGAARTGDSISVTFTRGGTPSSDRYRQVVNCLWDGKLPVDQQMNFLPPYRTLHRLKYGVSIALKQPDHSVPSATFVVGPLGDIVRFGDRRMYLSWYPIARGGISSALEPPDWPRKLEGLDARRMVDATLAAFSRLVVPMRGFHAGLFEEESVAGGIISAPGESDIDDPGSRLHTRSAVGIRSIEGYHSVDTGKYTLAPMYAMDIADRVCGTV